MLIPQETPCPECGHPRRDHELTDAASDEQCIQCGCTATTIQSHRIFWDPDAPATPFDWNFALITFIMHLDSDGGLFADTIERWQPGYVLGPGEREELREVELLVRDLWKQYGPKKPPLARSHGRNVADENAAVDRYVGESEKIKTALSRLAVTNEWKSVFPSSEHERILQVREIIARRGGTTLWEQEQGEVE